MKRASLRLATFQSTTTFPHHTISISLNYMDYSTPSFKYFDERRLVSHVPYEPLSTHQLLSNASLDEDTYYPAGTNIGPLAIPSFNNRPHSEAIDDFDDSVSLYTNISRHLFLSSGESPEYLEFQSNSSYYTSLHDPYSGRTVRPSTGLGLHLNEHRAEESNEILLDRSSLANPKHLISPLPDSSLARFLNEPFDNIEEKPRSPIYFTREDVLTEKLPATSCFTASADSFDTSGILKDSTDARPSFRRTSKFMVPQAQHKENCIKPTYSVAKCSPRSSDLLADISVFTRPQNGEMYCVRPQDLVGYIHSHVEEIAYSSSEDELSSVGSSLEIAIQAEERATTQTSIANEAQSCWPVLSTEQLSEVVDYFFSHLGKEPSTQLVDNSLDETAKLNQSPCPLTSDLVISSTQSIMNANNDNSGLNDICQNTQISQSKLIDKKNTFNVRAAANILELYGSLKPCDVMLDKEYEGVQQQDVAMKTKYFKLTHPGEKLSDELLFNFAGRLSQTGQAIAGYRCYIVGCTKTTRRKDHMGDHIRTHLGEKPFLCSIW